MTRLFPAIFIFFWASGFPAARFGTTDAGPFSFLLTRFILVALLFGAAVLYARAPMPRRGRLFPVILTGILIHGFYLGGVFFAVSRGMPAGVAGLISGLQPLLTALLARGFLGEGVSLRQYCGIACGMAGVALVVWPRIAGTGLAVEALPLYVVAAPFIGVFAMAAGTVIQKTTSAPKTGEAGAINLLSGNFIQALAGTVFFGACVLLIEPYDLAWTPPVTFAMLWAVLGISLGAVSILMVLIREGRMASVSSLFFMTPPVAAVMGYLAFGETLGLFEMAGFALASIGVWLAGRR